MATEKRFIDANEAVSIWENNLSIIRQMDTNGNMQKYIKMYEEFIDFLKNRPTVDAVEVVHGQWVMGFSVHCSVCNGYALTDEDYDPWLTPYCPNCGAKMDGERKDNESD